MILLDTHIWVRWLISDNIGSELIELIEKYDIKPNKAVQYLKEKPEVVPTLEKCETAVKKIPRFNVKILSVPIDAIFQSKELRKKILSINK